MKGLVTRNTHMQYESLITCGKKVMAKIKVFASNTDADADADVDANTRVMTLAPGHSSRLAKNSKCQGP